jgi:hypothetical protein
MVAPRQRSRSQPGKTCEWSALEARSCRLCRMRELPDAASQGGAACRLVAIEHLLRHVAEVAHGAADALRVVHPLRGEGVAGGA